MGRPNLHAPLPPRPLRGKRQAVSPLLRTRELLFDISILAAPEPMPPVAAAANNDRTEEPGRASNARVSATAAAEPSRHTRTKRKGTEDEVIGECELRVDGPSEPAKTSWTNQTPVNMLKYSNARVHRKRRSACRVRGEMQHRESGVDLMMRPLAAMLRGTACSLWTL